ncbi:MAG: TIGR03915 family putative DNA repair protein [Verrucomicrobiota bacterium]
MKTVTIEPHFDAWRERARGMLAARISPDEIVWETGDSDSGSLFQQLEPDPAAVGSEIRISRAFVQIATLAACHRSGEQWGLLYRAAWRLTHGGERHLLELKTDADVRKIEQFAAAIRRDRHKMKAFVRFRKIGENPDNNREQFVAWFEPEHRIVELTAPFFAKRFAGMDWSILTPDLCAHWAGHKLEFTPGVDKDSAPAADELDDFWRTYYASIFNPARLKLKAMQAEMPKKYWKNLPEAPLIDELTRQAATRVGDMIEAPTSSKSHVSERIPAGVPKPAPPPAAIDPAEVLSHKDNLDLDRLATLADECRACTILERATQTVFSVGPPTQRS